MRNKFLLAISFLLSCFFVFISFYALKYIQYEPIEAMSVSNNFLNLMMTNKLDQAYALTNENAIVGTTFDRFQIKVRQELDTDFLKNKNCDFEIKAVNPKQTYRTRLSRYLNGSKAEADLLNVEYYPCEVPFQISLRLNRNGNWKVINFQSHAD
ncbi:hypothetical protein [Leptospira weilii]|nr:hypothetical protein [Leptospira weilii]QDK24913.1 sugar:proton symporter [Leptospira weilii]QDK28870.1 sugar:proton symporter [Leptospira weilii]